MAEATVDVTNHMMHLHQLPAIPNTVHNEGYRLIPGLNRIPKSYFEAAEAFKTQVHDSRGRPVTEKKKVTRQVIGTDNKKHEIEEWVDEPVFRFPLRGTLKKLFEKPVRRITSQSKDIGPQLTMHRDGEIDPRTNLGPKPPIDLPEKQEHAIHMVQRTVDREALIRWSQFDPRDAVKQAISRQIASL